MSLLAGTLLEQRSGEHRVVFSNGAYTGQWIADKMSGSGTFTYANGSR